MKNKPFIVANVRDILDLYDKEEISFSKMVEMLNDVAEKFYTKPIVKCCETCKHDTMAGGQHPCCDCLGFFTSEYRLWEPK
jgi:hypothetical protein